MLGGRWWVIGRWVGYHLPPITDHIMRLADRHCTFCDLINGAGEVSICYEDRDAIAFMDIQPVNAGHVLVVSRRHYENLEDDPVELAMHLFRVASKLVPAVK